MCMNLYRHHGKCGCKLFAYIWVCEHGPKSPLCLHREYGLIEKKDSICRYHDYHDWRPPVPFIPSAIPVRPSPHDWTPPRHPRRRCSLDSSPWAPGEPDISLSAAKFSLRAHGRLAPARLPRRARAALLDLDPSDCASDRCPGCPQCAPPDADDHYTYAQGYNVDSWEDLYHPGFESGNDTYHISTSDLGSRTVALARLQRERRQRKRLGDERYEQRRALDQQRRRVKEEEEELRSRLAEHEALLAEYRECLRRIGMPVDEDRIPLAEGEEVPDLTYASEADMHGFLYY